MSVEKKFFEGYEDEEGELIHPTYKLVGEIDDLEKKLNGELPITREELIVLIDSWGRNENFQTIEGLDIKFTPPTKYYDLSKLDVSQITDMNSIFRGSLFDGDISNWDTSNVTNLSYAFYGTRHFNSKLPWDVSSVTSMNFTFFGARKFNQLLDWETKSLLSDFMTFGKNDRLIVEPKFKLARDYDYELEFGS